MSSTTSYGSLWRSQFELKNFLLSTDDSSRFAQSQWGEHVLPMAILRTVLFLYPLAVLIYASLQLGAKFFIFATYWGYLGLVIGLFVSSLNTWIYFFRKKFNSIDDREFENIGWNVKIQWVMTNVYMTMAFIATIVYWIFVFEGGVVFVNFNTHGVNIMIVLLELFFSGAPTRLLHLYQPTLVMLTYAIFTVIYWKAGGTNDQGQNYIYSIIDYDHKLKSGLALVFATALVAAPLLHVVVFLLYTLRVTIWRRCCSQSEEPSTVVLDRLSLM